MTGPVPLVQDLRIIHEPWGSSDDPSINGHLHYPNDVDRLRSLNEVDTDKIRKYRPDYNNNPPNAISFMTVIVSTSVRLHSDVKRQTGSLGSELCYEEVGIYDNKEVCNNNVTHTPTDIWVCRGC